MLQVLDTCHFLAHQTARRLKRAIDMPVIATIATINQSFSLWYNDLAQPLQHSTSLAAILGAGKAILNRIFSIEGSSS